MQPSSPAPSTPPLPDPVSAEQMFTQMQAQLQALQQAGPAVDAPAAPRTAQELVALRQRRDEAVDQLVATHSRRGELQEEMRQTAPGGQDVLRQQMTELDRRVLVLEKDVSAIDHAIAAAPTALGVESSVLRAVGSVEPRSFVLLGTNGPSANAVPALLLVITLFQVVLLLRTRMRRTPGVQTDAVARESAARLARVEAAVEAIAIEVERVSEGQRFVTRLLGEQQAQATRPVQSPYREHSTPH